jgi:hypothetical protein
MPKGGLRPGSGRPKGSKNSYKITSYMKGKTFKEIGRVNSLKGRTHLEVWGETSTLRWQQPAREKAIIRWSQPEFRDKILPLLRVSKSSTKKMGKWSLGKPAHNKGIPGPLEGKNYEQIYGEQANIEYEKRSLGHLRRLGLTEGSSVARFGNRYLLENGIWRRKVLRRDNFTCCKCKYQNKKGKNLHSHHIKPWATFETLRFVVSNGMTLCNPCHKEIHKEIRLCQKFLQQLLEFTSKREEDYHGQQYNCR